MDIEEYLNTPAYSGKVRINGDIVADHNRAIVRSKEGERKIDMVNRWEDIRDKCLAEGKIERANAYQTAIDTAYEGRYEKAVSELRWKHESGIIKR